MHVAAYFFASSSLRHRGGFRVDCIQAALKKRTGPGTGEGEREREKERERERNDERTGAYR